MEKLFHIFLVGTVLGVLFQTTANIKSLNKTMRVQSAFAKTK